MDMAEEKRFVRASWQIMEALLETERLEDALSEGLKIIVNTGSYKSYQAITGTSDFSFRYLGSFSIR